MTCTFSILAHNMHLPRVTVKLAHFIRSLLSKHLWGVDEVNPLIKLFQKVEFYHRPEDSPPLPKTHSLYNNGV
jgi:hypothetical protein